MTEKIVNWKTQKQEVINVHDVVENGILYKGTPLETVMVSAQSDLAELTNYPTGTIAYTVGFASMWQKDTDGTWVQI